MKCKNIFVDAWVSGNPGLGGWRGIYNKQVIFNRKPKSIITNNIGEYFALIDAIKWCKTNLPNDYVIIWTDSLTALSWYKKKKTKSNIKDDKLKDVILKTEKYLKNVNLDNIKILKWDTKSRGEIPADFGRKR